LPKLKDVDRTPFANINGLRTFYESKGKGKPLILVHGAGGTSAYWFNQLSELSRKLQVVAVDLPGHGKSERFKVNPTIRLYAGHVFDLVNQLKLAGVVMLGHSMGGLIVQQIALEHPKFLKKLIIVDSSAKFTVRHDYVNSMRHGADFDPIDFASRFFSPKTLKKANILSMLQQLTHGMTTSFDADVLADDFELTGKVDLRKRVKEIAIPTLIVHGADDIVPLQSAQFLHENIRGSVLEIIPDAGHLVMIEKPCEFNETILKFVET
jgi:pimeloyl-ACP methyl ester carboxylesterase